MLPEMISLIEKLRVRIDDVEDTPEFSNDELAGHLQNALDVYEFEFPLQSKRSEQLIVIEGAILVVKAIKHWADGNNYSYQNDAIRMTRSGISKSYKETIELLVEERNKILEMDGEVY